VVGADTPSGQAITAALLTGGGEVRAFVTDRTAGIALKEHGVKVAIGDLSDGSHVGAAALAAFTAVLIEEAASDGRPHAFARDAESVLAGWTTALREAEVARAIWVGDPDPSLVALSAPEMRVVAASGRSDIDIADEVADLNDRGKLPSEP
jgi:nucleoside-diphosphate-sugar epimerase